jgi:hypothetical protein
MVHQNQASINPARTATVLAAMTRDLAQTVSDRIEAKYRHERH